VAARLAFVRLTRAASLFSLLLVLPRSQRRGRADGAQAGLAHRLGLRRRGLHRIAVAVTVEQAEPACFDRFSAHLSAAGGA